MDTACSPADAPCCRSNARLGAAPAVRTRALAVVLPGALAVLGLGLLFATVNVPRPESLALPEVSVITYADARVGAQNRVEVLLSRVPEAAQRAVLAAENHE